MAIEFHYIGVGRMCCENGDFVAGKHVIIASACLESDKAYKQQVTDLMDQGGQKLLDKAIGKVVKMKAQDTSIWVTFHQDGDFILGFFAVSDLFQGATTETNNKLNGVKKKFLKENNEKDIMNAREKGGLHKANAQMLTASLAAADDKLAQAQEKARAAIEVQKENVGFIMQNQVKLSDIEETAANLEASAQVFKTRSTKVHRQMWWQNCRMNIMIGAGVLVVIIIIIVAVVASQKKT